MNLNPPIYPDEKLVDEARIDGRCDEPDLCDDCITCDDDEKSKRLIDIIDQHKRSSLIKSANKR